MSAEGLFYCGPNCMGFDRQHRCDPLTGRPKRKPASGLALARRRARRVFMRLWNSKNTDWGYGSMIQRKLDEHDAFEAFFTAWQYGMDDEGNLLKKIGLVFAKRNPYRMNLRRAAQLTADHYHLLMTKK